MSYTSLLPLLKKTGSPLSPEDFQARVNVVFHDFESDHYDSMHDDMWESLQEQINLLVSDWLAYETPSQKLRLVDIGCGTGLSSQLLLQSPLGNYIEEVTLVDTSSKMLEHAKEKAQNWGKKTTYINGYLSDITESYDIVLICSVLHHIPDLKLFLEQVSTILKPQGVFMHLQDPNGDYLNDPIYKERLSKYQAIQTETAKKTLKDLIPNQWIHFVNRMLGRKNYIDLINDQLLAEQVIRKRMSADEIWSVTDIHVESKINTENAGISFDFLQRELTSFTLIKQRAYAFYSVLKSKLPGELKEIEDQLVDQNALNGRNISCLWKKN